MNYLDWYVGMKVVCIDIPWSPNVAFAVARGCRLPEAGRIYTIRDLGVSRRGGEVIIRLCEIRNPRIAVISLRASEPGFSAWRFRPLQKHKTDISIFKAMLTDTKQKVPA